MKALEILYKIDTEYKYASLNTDSCIRSSYVDEAIKELEVIQDIILEKDEALVVERLLFRKKLETLENKSCNNCKNASFEVKFGELEFNACFLVSNGNACKYEPKQ